jgi:hypothetical protein
MMFRVAQFVEPFALNTDFLFPIPPNCPKNIAIISILYYVIITSADVFSVEALMSNDADPSLSPETSPVNPDNYIKNEFKGAGNCAFFIFLPKRGLK